MLANVCGHAADMELCRSFVRSVHRALPVVAGSGSSLSGSLFPQACPAIKQVRKMPGTIASLHPAAARTLATMAHKPVETPKMDLLKTRRALVTGAQRGIGRAIAEAYAGQAAALILHAEPSFENDLNQAAEACRTLGARDVEVMTADFSSPSAADDLAKKVLDKYGYVDVLVNNAGSYGPMSLEKGPNKGQGPLDGDPAEWDRLMNINLLSPMHLTRWLAPVMKDRGEGFIINIASIEALSPYPSAPAYASSKWGFRGWSKSIWAALKADNVFSVTINPAQTDTPMTQERPDQEMIPELEVMPEDIAEVALLHFKLSKNVVLEEITVQTGKTPKKPKK